MPAPARIRVGGQWVDLSVVRARRGGVWVALPSAARRITGGASGNAYAYRQSLNGQEGTYKPDTSGGNSNVGLIPGRTLTPGPTGYVTVNSAATFKDLDCSAYFLINTSQPVVFDNCRIRGYSAPGLDPRTGYSQQPSAMINCDPSALTGNSNVLITDCLLQPDYPTGWDNGVIGHDFTCRRTVIRDCVDGFNVRNTSAAGSSANTNILGNWVTDVGFFTPDPNQNRASTHCDMVQVVGNTGHFIKGNVFWGKTSPRAGTAPVGTGTGSEANTYAPSVGRGINLTSTFGSTIGVYIGYNWFDYSIVPVSLRDGSATVEFNQFGSHLPVYGGAERPIEIYTTYSMAGVPGSGTTATQPGPYFGNVYEGTGAPAPWKRSTF